MTKIKNFRITLRPREIARWLKHQGQTVPSGDLDATAEAAAARYKTLVHPAAVYTTLTRATAEKTTPLALPESSVAVSIIAVNVGGELAKASAALAETVDPAERAILQAIEHEALQQSIHFAVRLLGDQAKDEECEMSPVQAAEEPLLLVPLAALLGIERIGISLDAEHPAVPSYARLVWNFWTPLRKAGARKGEAHTAKAAA
jgi:hypothetical protein